MHSCDILLNALPGQSEIMKKHKHHSAGAAFNPNNISASQRTLEMVIFDEKQN